MVIKSQNKGPSEHQGGAEAPERVCRDYEASVTQGHVRGSTLCPEIRPIVSPDLLVGPKS